MAEQQASAPGRRDWWFGLLIPMPLFFQVQGTPALYGESWKTPLGLGVPIGFLAAALLLLPDLQAMRARLPLDRLPRIAIGILCVWVFLLGVTSAWVDPVSLLHALQWIAPVCLVSYVAVVSTDPGRLKALLAGLRRGTAVALLFLLGLFVVEVLADPGFAGRITQNRFFPGMYQLYNYVPVGMTLAGVFCAGLAARTPGGGQARAAWLFLLGSAAVPLWTGARDPALVYLLAAPFPAWWLLRFRGLLLLASGCAAWTFVLLLLADGDLLLLKKFHAMFGRDVDGRLTGLVGNRAAILADYWGLVERHPILGTRMLPPWIFDPESGVTAKGAHNSYLDTLAWAGPIGLLGLLGLAWSALKEMPRLLLGPDPGGADLLDRAARAAAAPAATLLLISSNLRTPLREPISAMAGYVLLGLILAWAHRLRRV